MKTNKRNVIIEFQLWRGGGWVRSGNGGTIGFFTAADAASIIEAQRDHNHITYRSVRVNDNGTRRVVKIFPATVEQDGPPA